MKKLIFLLSLIIIFSSCATENKYRIHTQKQGLMILDNTEMDINKKYHNQKISKRTKHIKHRKYKKTGLYKK